jgi:raffinose/stachyose/melibiose transport system substrate-binding protein
MMLNEDKTPKQIMRDVQKAADTVRFEAGK